MRFTRVLLAAALVCLPLAMHGQGYPAGGPSLLGRASQFSYDPAGTGCSATATNVDLALDELCAGGGGGGGGGTNIILDISDDGANESSAIGEIAITNATAGVATEPTPNKLLLNFSDVMFKSLINSVGGFNSQLAGADFVHRTSTYTSGHCAQWLASGELGSTGAACTILADPVTVVPSTSTEETEVLTTSTTCDLDDCPGVADGAGADPNPYPGTRDESITSGVFLDKFLYTIDPIHMLSGYNAEPLGVRDPDLYVSTLNFEYGYDASQRSGKEQIEFYWQFIPATYRVTFADGGTNAISLGMNLTFTGGEQCRPAQEDADLSTGTTLRMTCVDSAGVANPPESGDVITACTGPASPAACSPLPSASVSGTPFDEATGPWRPFFYELFTSTNRVSWKQQKGVVEGTTTPTYWLSAQPTVNRMFLGRSDFTDTNYSTVNIPAAPGAGACQAPAGCTGDPDIQKSGDLVIDATNAGTYNTTPTTGAQFRYVAVEDVTESIGPVRTICSEAAVTDGTQNNIIDFGVWQPATVVAMGCRNKETADAGYTNATLTLETLGGTSIPLDTTLTCAGNDQAMTFVPTDASWQDSTASSRLASGAGLRFDETGSPTPDGDLHTICIAYRDTPQ